MKIEVGKSYRTRGGWRAEVKAINPGEQGVKVLHEKDHHRAFHEQDGSWAGKDCEHDWDLVSEWDDWIEWNGGECPVAEGVRGSVRLRSGKEYHDKSLANWRWTHSDGGLDIIAYRVVQEEKEPTPYVTGLSTSGESNLVSDAEIIKLYMKFASEEPELTRLMGIAAVLKTMTPAEQSRALAYLNSRFGE